MEGHKAEKLFSLIYGLSLTIMKDIQGVFWGCPRIEALFWPGLGGYVTALTGRALEWHSRGQRFDPAYLHHEESCIRKDAGFFLFPRCFKPPGCQQIISPDAASQRPAFCMPCLPPPGFFTDAGQLSAQSCLWDLRCDRVKPQRKNRLRERGNDMFALFLVIVYYIVGLLRESYLEFVAAEYYCDQCRWMAESKRSGQLPEDRKYWEH